MQRRVNEFEKKILGAYKLLAGKDAQIKMAMRAVRAERQRAAATAARSANYDTAIPAIAAKLQNKLSSTMVKIRTPDDASKQMIESIKAEVAAFEKAKPDVEEIRKLR